MQDSIAQRVAECVHLLMRRQHKTQADLGLRLGLSQAGVSRRLAGQVEFTVSELVTVARFLDVPLADLLPMAVA